MAITLEQLKTGLSDKVDQNVAEEFRKSSPLLEKMVFDDAVAPGGTDSTLTYGYLREKTPAVAGFRELNREYAPQESEKEKHSVDLKIFGGSFEVDRVTNTARSSEVTRQMKDKIAATSSLFNYTVINGDTESEEKSFDGLDKALLGTNTEIGAETYLDLSSSDAMDMNYKKAMDMLDEFLANIVGTPSFLMGNNFLIARIRGIARRAGYLTQQEDAFGKKVEAYGNIPLLDLGYFTSVMENTPKEVPVVPIEKRTIASVEVAGLTDLYAPVIDLTGFHGVTLTGNNMINSYLPDFITPGAVKKGEVEMVAAVALKSTRKAGVLRNIKIK